MRVRAGEAKRRVPHHFPPLHLRPAGDPGERTGEDQGRPLDPQTLWSREQRLNHVWEAWWRTRVCAWGGGSAWRVHVGQLSEVQTS